MTNIKIQRLDSSGSDSRFYQGVTEEGEVKWVYPSVTSILGDSVPTGHYLAKWQRDNGLYSQVIFEKAGEEGTHAHEIIESLLNRQPVNSEGLPEKVKKCVQSFVDWYNEFQPKILATEQIVVNHDLQYAGGCDFICELDYGKYQGVYVIDWKTSSAIHEQHHYQVEAYRQAIVNNNVAWRDAKCALVQLGSRHKAGYNFTEVDSDEAWRGFKMYNEVYRFRNPNAKPNVKEYPDVFTINIQDDE